MSIPETFCLKDIKSLTQQRSYSWGIQTPELPEGVYVKRKRLQDNFFFGGGGWKEAKRLLVTTSNRRVFLVKYNNVICCLLV